MKDEQKFKLNLQNFAEGDEEEQHQTDEEESSLADVIKKQQEKLANSVSKEDFEKLKAENEKLTNIIIDGGPLPGSEEEIEEIDIDELAKHIFSTQNQDNNLEFVENALKYRKAMLDQKGIDVFAPKSGSKYSVTDDDIATAERVADVLQQCVDESDGDSGVFTAKLQSRINDDPITKRGQIKRR